MVGEVVAVGEGVSPSMVGARVAIRAPHASYVTLDVTRCLTVPESISTRDAIWHGLAHIALVGARAADHQLGDEVLVVGAGPIGQLSIRWACASGVESVVVVERSPLRASLASAGGAARVIRKRLGELTDGDLPRITLRAPFETFDGPAPRVAIDTTGNPAVLAELTAFVRPFGKIVLLGDPGHPSQQRLTGDVITKGLTIVGAHDVHVDSKWNVATNTRLFFAMLESGRVKLSGMVTHEFDARDCANAYRLLSEDKANTVGVAFRWAG
jgi:threonine dehydrogenase-like Zn-dependent dehydrogenase